MSRPCPLRTQHHPQEITNNSEGAFEGGYTVDGVAFFDTLAAMKSSLEEDKIKAELAIANASITKEEVMKKIKTIFKVFDNLVGISWQSNSL